jgi:endoglycosylceramidase
MLLVMACGGYRKPSDGTDGYIRDNLGRIIIWHGVNVSNAAKHIKNGRAGVTWHESMDYRRLQSDLGFNAVRYLVFWEALEPTAPGVIDYEYLRSTVTEVQEITAAGLDVIVDMHQDLFAQKFTGDGFPAWAIKDHGEKFKNHEKMWTLNLLEPPVIWSWTEFWKDTTMQRAYIGALRTFKNALDTIHGVYGFDPMNEPFMGALSGNFEGDVLTGFYSKISQSIDWGDQKVFFEPWHGCGAGIPTGLGTVCGVYAPHYYDPLCHEGGSYGFLQAWYMRKMFNLRKMEAEKISGGLVFGEWGISTASGNWETYVKDFLGHADRVGSGWFWWSYDRASEGGFGLLNDSLNWQPQARILTRPYPRRIAGDSPRWSVTAGHFTLEYFGRVMPAATEVFIPYGLRGLRVKLQGEAFPCQGGVMRYSVSTPGPVRIEATWRP